MPRQHRHGYAAGLHRDLPASTPSQLRSRPPAPDDRALHPGPYPPDLSRCHAYGALALVPLVYRLISLAGPGPSGSTRPSRLCQRCFPPSPAPPGSDCAQLPPDCCDSLARRSRTSFDSQRLTAHQRLVAHHQRHRHGQPDRQRERHDPFPLRHRHPPLRGRCRGQRLDHALAQVPFQLAQPHEIRQPAARQHRPAAPADPASTAPRVPGGPPGQARRSAAGTTTIPAGSPAASGLA